MGNDRIVSWTVGHSVPADRAYAPYGQQYNTFGSTNPIYGMFAGLTGDYDSGILFDTPNREFAQYQGRWISPDPAAAGWNLYAYPTNPNSFTDPSGLCGQTSYVIPPCPEKPGDPGWAVGTAPVDLGNVPGLVFVGPDPSKTMNPNATGAAPSPGDSIPPIYVDGVPLFQNPHAPSWVTTAWNKYNSSGVPSGAHLSGTRSGFNPATGEDTSDVDISMNIDANVRALAPAMEQGAAFANAATKYTGYTYVAAATAVVGGPTIVNAGYNLGARAVGWYLGLTGGTGVVLGQYDEYTNYVQAAESVGANALNAPRLYNLFNSAGQWWTLNQSFLSASVFRGQQFFMSSPVLGATGNYALELQYLMSRGIGPNQWQMVPLPY